MARTISAKGRKVLDQRMGMSPPFDVLRPEVLRAVALALSNRSGAILKRRRATTCSYYKSSCRGQRCGAVCSFSAPFMRWSVRRPMPRISIRANRRRGCLRIVARPVIAARQLSPRGGPAPSYSSSCRSIMRPVRTRPRSSLRIWPRSTPDGAAGRRQTPGRLLRHADHRSVRPKRCRPRQRIEIIEELSFVATFQRRRIAYDCEATTAALRLGTTTRRVNSPLL
jgi:hypothetical protein